ncbi:hypothetical protein SAMN05444680_10157 [Variovorax sp. YR216]|nr:hypothetical protein SAMN05444680_10157 [Variovorax sp. YR216]
MAADQLADRPGRQPEGGGLTLRREALYSNSGA